MNEEGKKFRSKYSVKELTQQAEKENQTVGSQIAQFLTGGTDNPKVESVVREMLTKEDEETLKDIPEEPSEEVKKRLEELQGHFQRDFERDNDL